MLWAREQGLGLALHYCSLENKHRAQVRNMNEPFADIHACYAFDYDDFFLKTALAFDGDRDLVRRALEREGCRQVLEDAEGGVVGLSSSLALRCSSCCAGTRAAVRVFQRRGGRGAFPAGAESGTRRRTFCAAYRQYRICRCV